MSETLLIEVGHAHSISQPNLLTMRQASQKGVIGKEVDGSCREVNLVECQLWDLQALETGLHTLTNSSQS